MILFKKFKEQGVLWFVRRIVREFVAPTTTLGQYLKPCSFFVYYLINKPMNFILTLTSFHGNKESNSDCLYFFYDFEVEPITYDFSWALCIANARREELGLARLKVVFVPGYEHGLRKESVQYEQIVGYDARSWRIHAMLLPVIKLLPCPSSIVLCATREEAFFIREQQAKLVYPEKYNVTFPVPYSPQQAMQYGQKFMGLQADRQALDYVGHWLSLHACNRKVIVITLRQYAYSPERNSHIADWAMFASSLSKDHYFVVFVPDTEVALCDKPDELKEFVFFDPACWNLIMRAALYELAYLNLGVNNGAMALCWLNSRCRYITFKTIVRNSSHEAIQVLIARGFVPGESPSFTNAFQKWSWDEDDFHIITQEFELMCDAINKGVLL